MPFDLIANPVLENELLLDDEGVELLEVIGDTRPDPEQSTSTRERAFQPIPFFPSFKPAFFELLIINDTNNVAAFTQRTFYLAPKAICQSPQRSFAESFHSPVPIYPTTLRPIRL